MRNIRQQPSLQNDVHPSEETVTDVPSHLYSHGPDPARPTETLTGAEWTFLIGFVAIVWATAYGLRSLSWKHFGGRFSHSLEARNIPCKTCRFYNQNAYLKCAVHPSRASTPKATSCSDYWSGQADKFESE